MSHEDDLLTQIETPTTTYDFTYGNFSLRTEVKIGNRSLATYNYQKELEQGENDRKNDLDLLCYGNGDFISYEYDDQGRVTKETFEDGDTVTYKYNNDGYLASVTDSHSGITTVYYYDFLGRLMSYKETGRWTQHSVSYSYDTLNNLTAVKDSYNGTTSYVYDDDNRVTSVTNGNVSKSYTYDSYGRVSGRIARYGTTQVYSETNTFKAPGQATTSGQLLSQRVTAAGYDVTHSYTYDDNGNILSVSDGTYTTSYVYDSQNQLIRENNQRANKTLTWTYDAAGNIQNRKEYAYTTGTLGTPTDTVNYTYGDVDWGDLLTGYDGRTYTYDGIGNPLSDGVRTYTWEHGRRLTTLDDWELGYDGNGMRLIRDNNFDNIWYTYYYNSSGQLIRMFCSAECWSGLQWYYADLTFTYDADGNPMSANHTVGYEDAGEYMEFTGMFYYVTNAQGDVTALVSETGELLATYDYDAWGKPIHTEYYEILTDNGYVEASWFAAQNPFRYRGYVYDTETGLYYLQSRYYDPEVGRFINVDSYFSTGTGLLGNNMFSYCNNNPACCLDACGTRPVSTLEGFEGLPVPPPQRKRKRNNDDAVADFFEVSSWEDIPNLPDGAMLFVENITSVSVGTFVSAIRGKALVMDRDKYCVYTFVGLSFGIGGVSNALLDKTCTKGYVYGVEDIGDYSGIFFGGSSNMVSSVEGGAWAPNGVYAEIIGGVNVVASVGGSAAWYSTTQTDWIYGAADYYVVPNVYSRSPLDTNKIF